VVVEKPFVVIGDEEPRVVRDRVAGTVRWAAVRLRRGFFDRDPEGILEVWLFKGRRSYESNARSLFGSTPSSPYGYFSPRHRALVMNIATGGGTLVHEMVHAYMASNVPDCPAWYNEGLGSLFEQCRDRGGEIVGLTNWRLAGLKEAIREGRTTSFETLCGKSDAQFYGEGRGVNYAQARYLLYHLQEKGKLRTFHRAFLAARKTDPTGYATLVKTLGETDMKAFEARWNKWVLTLTFP
jgi:hypothetical protein